MLSQIDTLISMDNRFIESWKQKGRPILGYACSHIPEEMVYAGGILPVRLTGTLEPPKAADVYLPVNVCSYAKSCVSQAIMGEYDFLDGYIATNSCDNQNKVYDLWKHCTPIPNYYFINTPHSTTDKSLKFFYEELERFRKWLTETFEVTINDETLTNTMSIYNENRKLLKHIYSLRKRHPPQISGSEALNVVLSSMKVPKEEHNKLLQGLLDEICNREVKEKDCPRLLVSGSFMGSSELLKLIEGVGGCVVADDLCTGSRYFWNLVKEDGNPMKAIAERYLRRIPCPILHSSEERFGHVKEMVKRFDVEGVLIFSLKFCDVHSFDAPLLVDELREDEGLQVLSLEWEHSLSGIAQLKTRIEAFIEMLEE